MKQRNVAHIIHSEVLDMGGTKVKQALPTQQVQQISPFLLLHHFGPYRVEPGHDPLDVGPHPHRGFEPVTFLLSGGIRHKDSRGNEGLLRGGDVQWMTAGRGIIHSERASPEFLDKGGTMEGIQLWVNLPKAHKMEPARYQDIKADRIPVLLEENGRVRLSLVAGKYNGEHGPAATFTPILAMLAQIDPSSTANIRIPDTYNALIYILDGHLELSSGFEYSAETLIHFKQDGEGFSMHGISDIPAKVLILAGEPIDEPTVSYGPFVMNTQTEIMEAMRDYQMGKMGFYID